MRFADACRAFGLRAKATLILVGCLAFALLCGGHAAGVVWDNGNGTASWDDVLNWDTDLVPTATDAVVLPATIPAGGGTITLGSGDVAASLEFQNSYTLTGGDLTLGASGAITVAAGSTGAIASQLSGGGGLTFTGGSGATLVLSGANTIAGATRISSGTLTLNHANALQNSMIDMNAADSGTLAFGGGITQTTIGGLTGSRDINLGGKTLNIGNNNASTTYSGSFSNGTIAKLGTGTLTLSGSATNLAAGTLTMTGSNGTLLLGHNNALGGSATLAVNGGRIGATIGSQITSATAWNDAGDVSFLGGDLTLSANGTLGAGRNLSAAVLAAGAYSGALTLSGNVTLAGTGRVGLGSAGNAVTLGAPLTIAGSGTPNTGLKAVVGPLATGGNQLTVSGSLAIGGNITGGGALVKNDAGTLILKGTANTQSATTIGTGGRLIVSDAGALGSGSLTLTGATLQIGDPNKGLLGVYYDTNTGANANFGNLTTLTTWAQGLTTIAQVAPTTTGGNAGMWFRDENPTGRIFGSQGFNTQYNWTAIFDGYLNVPTTGDYQFYSGSDDGSVLYLDGNPTPVVNNNFDQGYPGNAPGPVTKNLTAGLHKITAAVYQGGGGAGYTLQWNLGGTLHAIPNEYLFLTADGASVPGSFSAGNAVSASGAAGVDVSPLTAGTTASLGALTLASGTNFTTTGGGRTAAFAGTTLASGGDYTFGGDGNLNLGPLAGSPVALNSLTKNGGGAVAFTGTVNVGAGGLTVSGGTLNAGPLKVAGGLTHSGSEGAKVIAPSLDLDGGTRIVSVAAAAAQLTIAAPLSNGAIDKQGPGRLLLNPASAGSLTAVTVTGGALQLGGASPVGGAPITMKDGATLIPGTELHTAGLLEGWLPYANIQWGTRDPNPGQNGIQTGPRRGQTNAVTGNRATGWADNTTFVYTGQFFDADGRFSFAENIDDEVGVWIDGALRLSNTGWNAPTSTGGYVNQQNGAQFLQDFGMGPNGDGWHTVEIRMSNGGGGAGAVDGNGWAGTSKGFGLRNATTLLASLNGGDYVVPTDPGDMSLFRTVGGYAPVSGTSANNVTLEGNATFDLANGVGAGGSVSFGILTRGQGSTVTTTGTGRSIAFAGTKFNAGAGNTVFAGAGNVALGPIDGTLNSVAALVKQGSGNLSFSGTLNTGAITLSGGALQGGTISLTGATPTISHPAGASGPVSISGTGLNLGGGTVALDIARNAASGPDLTISAPISNGGIAKTGAGHLTLSSAASTFAGGLSFQGGKLAVTAAGALGAGTVTLNGATLQIGSADVQAMMGTYYTDNPADRGTFNNLASYNSWFAARTPVLTTPSNTNGNTQFWFHEQTYNRIFAGQGFDRSDNYSARFDGYVVVPKNGSYNFYLGSDDGTVMYLDLNGDGAFDQSELIVDNDYMQGHTVRSNANLLRLAAGPRRAMIAMYQGGGNASFTVESDLTGSRQRLANSSLVYGLSAPTTYSSTNPVTVVESSTIDVTLMSSAAPITFGPLTLAAGKTLSVAGADRTVSFAGTKFNAGAGDTTFNASANVALGAIDGTLNTVASLVKQDIGTVSYTGTLNTPAITTSGGAILGGTLNLTGPTPTITYPAGATAAATVGGTTINLGGGTVAVNVNRNTAVPVDLTLDGALTNGAISKMGAGNLGLKGTASTFAGGVNVQNGQLHVLSNGALGAGTVTLGAGTKLVLSGPQAYSAGLWEGYLNTNYIDTSAARPANPANYGLKLVPRLGENNLVTQNPATGWSDNALWVYTGEFYDADGKFAFAENIDDVTAIWIDGQLRLHNGDWGTPTTTGSATNNAYGGMQDFGMGPNGDGWHTFELRMSNGGGGAGPVGGNGWNDGKGFGLRNATSGLDSNNGDNYVIPVDPGNGTLFRVANGRTPFVGHNPVVMSGSAEVDLTAYLTGATANLGPLAMPSGATLTVTGAGRTVNFDATQLPGGGGTVNFAGDGNLGLGRVAADTGNPTTVNDQLPAGSVLALVGGATTSLAQVQFNVPNSGQRFGLFGAADGGNALGGATVNLGAGAILRTGAVAAGSGAMAGTVNFAGAPTIENVGPFDAALAAALNVPAATTLTLDGQAGALTINSAISANVANVVKVGSGAVYFGGTYAGGPMTVNAGTLGVAAANVLNNNPAVPVTVNAGGTFTVGNVSDTVNLLQVNPGGAAATGTGTLSATTLQLAGGFIRVGAGGKFMVPAGGLSSYAPATARPSYITTPLTATTPGQVDTSTSNVFNIADGPPALDLSISAAIVGTGGIVKRGPGTLFLAGANTFSGGITMDGGTANNAGFLAIASNAALGAAANQFTFPDVTVNRYAGGLKTIGYVTLSAADRLNVAAGTTGILDVSTDAGFSNNDLHINAQIAGGGTIRKIGWGNLIFNGIGTPTAAASLSAEAGYTYLRARTSALGAQPTVAVNRAAMVIADGAWDMDLSNLTVNGYTHPQAPAPNGYWLPDRLYYAGQLRVHANLGNDANARFPTANINGVLELNSWDMGINGALNAAGGGAYVPKMGHLSTIRAHWFQYTNTTLNGDVFLEAVEPRDGSVRIYGQFNGSGGLMRVGGNQLDLFADNTYTGKTIIDSPGVATYLAEANGKLSGSTDIRIMGGILQHDNWTNIVDKRFNDAAVIKMLGGTFVYQGRQNSESAAGTAPEIRAVGAGEINTNRPDAGYSATLTVTTLSRDPGGTMNFTGPGLGTGGNSAYTKITSGPLSTTAVTPWAYVNNADWAIYDATNGVKAFSAYYTGLIASALATDNVSLAANDSTTTPQTINSLRLTGSGTLTLGNAATQDLTLTSGGLLANASGTWTIDGGTNLNKLVAGAAGAAELVVNTSNALELKAPVVATGLAKSGGGRLILNNYAGTDYKGGALQVNAGILEIREPGALTGAGTIISTGGQIEFHSDSATTVDFAKNIHIKNSAIGDRNLHVDRVTGGGPTGVRHKVGTLTVDPYVRLFQVRSANNDSLTFGSTTFGDAVYMNLDSPVANPWQFGVGAGESVTLNGRVWFNLWNGDSEWGKLAGTGTEWTKTGGAKMSLKAAADPAYRATVEHTQATLQVDADGALGTGTGGSATVVNVRPTALLNFGVAQTTLPTINLDRYAAIGGSLGADPAIYAGGANKVNLPVSDAVFVNASVLPALAARGANRDWLGLSSNGTPGSAVSVDPTASIYRGVAVGPFTPGGDYVGDLASTAGDLAILMLGEKQFIPSSSSAVQKFDSATGVVGVFGPSLMWLGSNGGNGVQGSFTRLSRYGDARTQNNDLLALRGGAGALRAGRTVDVFDGRVRVYDNANALAAGATLNIGGGATLLLHDTPITSGTVNFLNDERGAGALWINNQNRMSTSRYAGTLNFQDGAQIVLETSLDPTVALLPNNAAYIVMGDGRQMTSSPLTLGAGGRLTTMVYTDGAISGFGVTAAAGAEPVISAAAGRRLGLYDAFTFTGTAQVGDAAQYAPPLWWGNMTRQPATQDGVVEFNKFTLAAGATLKMVNGQLRLGWTWSNPPDAPIINGLIDDSVRPDNVIGGGPYLEVHSGRDGNAAMYVGGTGTVRLGRGEDISIVVNEVDNPGSGNPNKVNEFRVAVNVLGAGETSTASLGGRANYTGLLRSIRGDDRNGQFALARYTKVRPNAGAVVALDTWNENRILADFELTGSPTGPRPAVASNRDDWSYVSVGNVTTPDDTERWLQVGVNGSSPNNPQDLHMDLAGAISGKANISMNSREMVRLERISLDGVNTYSAFSLGGRTLELKGYGITESAVDPGPGTISIANAWRQWNQIALDQRFGRDGGAWGAGSNVTFASGQFRTAQFRVNDVATGNPQKVNNFTGSVNAGPGGAGVLLVEGFNVWDAVKGRLQTNLGLGEGGALVLRTNDNKQLQIDAVTLNGSGTLINEAAPANVWVNRVALAAGNTTAQFTVAGPQQLRITGSGATPAVSAAGINVLGELSFEPGSGNTATVNSPVAVGNKLIVQNGTVDLGSQTLTTFNRAAGAQPISALFERYYRPDRDFGLAADAWGDWRGDPYVAFEKATAGTTFINTATPNSSGTATMTTALNLNGDGLVARATALAAYPAAALQGVNDQIGAAWRGTITVGGAGNPIQPGAVTFGTASDDGTVIYIDLNRNSAFEESELVVDNRGGHGHEARVATTLLGAGTYDVAIGFYQGYGGVSIDARWAPGSVLDWNQLTTIDPSGSFPAYNGNGIAQIEANATLRAGAATLKQVLLNGPGAAMKLTNGGAAASSTDLLRIAGSGLTGNSVELAATHVLTVNTNLDMTAAAGATLAKLGLGTLRINGAQNYNAGGSVINLQAGTLAFGSDGGANLTINADLNGGAVGLDVTGAAVESPSQLNIAAGTTLNRAGSGTLNIANAGFAAANTTLNAQAGTTNVSASAGSGTLKLNATGTTGGSPTAGTVNLAGPQTLATLGVNNQGVLNVSAGAVSAPQAAFGVGTLNHGDQAVSINGAAANAFAWEAGANLAVAGSAGGKLVLQGGAGTTASVGAGAQLSIAAGATTELAGTVAATAQGTNRVHVVNQSLAASGGLYVTGTNQRVGAVSGAGHTLLATGANLEAVYVRQAALDIAASATMEIATNPTPTNKAATVSVLTSALAAPNNSLRIANGGVFDLNNNDLIMYYPSGTGATALATVQQYIYDGFINTAGVPQIKADTSLGTFQTYAVAFDNGALPVPNTTWDSQPLPTLNEIIVKYTYRGDLDLNGVVDGNDFTVVQMNFGLTGLGLGKGWMKGDADLDGDVDGNDFTVIQANFGGGSGGPLAPPPVGNVVPEPSTLALVLLAGLAALGAALRGFRRSKRQ